MVTTHLPAEDKTRIRRFVRNWTVNSKAMLLTFGVLANRDERLRALAELIGLRVDGDKLNIIVHSHNASISTRFDVLLADIARFVVKKSMRVTGPGSDRKIFR